MPDAVEGLHALHIVVIAWNRPQSLDRLLQSLSSAEYGPSPAPINLTLAFDFMDNETIASALDGAVRSFANVWHHGGIRIRQRMVHAGLRENVLGAWLPTSEQSPPSVFLEDDVEVSPLWYAWVQACLRRYTPPPVGLIGLSLFTPDDLNEAFLNADRGRDPVTRKSEPSCSWQALHARSRRPPGESAAPAPASAVYFSQPVSWGGLYFAGPWRKFLMQAHSLRLQPREQQATVPCPSHVIGCRPGLPDRSQVVVNRWGRNSWKRLLALHMVAHGQYMVYPNLPKMASFSMTHVEEGVHVNTIKGSNKALLGQRQRHKRQLVDLEWCSSNQMRCALEAQDAAEGHPFAFELPSLHAIRLWDFYCDLQPVGEAGTQTLLAAGERVRSKLPSPTDLPTAMGEFDQHVREVDVRSRMRTPQQHMDAATSSIAREEL